LLPIRYFAEISGFARSRPIRLTGVGRFQVGEVIGCQHLPLDDGEIDLDLIELTGMDRGMEQDDTGIGLMQPLLCSFTTMRRAIVHNPEQAFPGSIRFLRQHLMDQPAKWFDAGGRFTPSHHAPPANLPCGQILQGTAALVFVLDVGWSVRGAGMNGSGCGPECWSSRQH
jgi:hypothetical protein